MTFKARMKKFNVKSIDLTTKILIYNIDECNKTTKKLIEKAQDIALHAYAPYSNFHVGAAVLLANGKIVTGSNQENAAFPAGMCAERTAMAYANSQYPDIPAKAIATVAYHNNEMTDEICSPCGVCRQFLLEVETKFNHPLKVIMCSKNEIYEAASVKDLLPLCFDKSNLD